jgi:hypothetical protein
MGDNVVVLQHKEGENLMFKRVILKHEKKATEEPEQKKRVLKLYVRIKVDVAIWS